MFHGRKKKKKTYLYNQIHITFAVIARDGGVWANNKLIVHTGGKVNMGTNR